VLSSVILKIFLERRWEITNNCQGALLKALGVYSRFLIKNPSGK